MISAFGVEHGDEISKLGPPQIRGHQYSLIEHDKGTTTTHSPDTMHIRDTKKKTLILRRPKYSYEYRPNAKTIKGAAGRAMKSNSPLYVHQSALSKPHGRDTRKEISSFVQGGKKKATIRGMKVERD